MGGFLALVSCAHVKGSGRANDSLLDQAVKGGLRQDWQGYDILVADSLREQRNRRPNCRWPQRRRTFQRVARARLRPAQNRLSAGAIHHQCHWRQWGDLKRAEFADGKELVE